MALHRRAAVSVYRAMVRDARLRRAPHHEALCVFLIPYQPFMVPSTRASAARAKAFTRKLLRCKAQCGIRRLGENSLQAGLHHNELRTGTRENGGQRVYLVSLTNMRDAETKSPPNQLEIGIDEARSDRAAGILAFLLDAGRRIASVFRQDD